MSLFWIAFPHTRPLGATGGEFLTEPIGHGCLGLGTPGSSAVLLAALFGLITHAHIRERRGPPVAVVR